MLCLYGWFLKWWYPQKHPKMIICGRKKPHGCWVPAFSETPIWYFKGTSDSQKWIGFRCMIQTHPDVSWKSDVIQPLLGRSCFLGCSWNLRFVPLKPGDGKQISRTWKCNEIQDISFCLWDCRLMVIPIGYFQDDSGYSRKKDLWVWYIYLQWSHRNEVVALVPGKSSTHLPWISLCQHILMPCMFFFLRQQAACRGVATSKARRVAGLPPEIWFFPKSERIGF